MVAISAAQASRSAMTAFADWIKYGSQSRRFASVVAALGPSGGGLGKVAVVLHGLGMGQIVGAGAQAPSISAIAIAALIGPAHPAMAVR